MYAASWHIIPNLAADLLITPLLYLLPLHAAGRILLALSLLLPFQGIVAYHRVTAGRASLWPLGAGLVAYSAIFLLGTSSFLISSGLALFAAAFWLKYRASNPAATLILAGIAAVVLFFAHLIGLLFFFVLISTSETERLLEDVPPQPFLRTAASRLAGLICVGSAPLALFLAVGFDPSAEATLRLPWSAKLLELTVPFRNYDQFADAGTFLAVVAAIELAVLRRWVAAPSRTGIALAILAAMFAVAPFQMAGGGAFDMRFPVLMSFMVFAGITPTRPPRAAVIGAVAGFALLFGVRMTYLATLWYGHNADVAQLRETIAPVPAGARVLVARVSSHDMPAYWQKAPRTRRISQDMQADLELGAFLVFERKAFYPLMFANPTQQPLVVLPPYTALSAPGAAPPRYQALDSPDAFDLAEAPYLADWEHKFDYLLLLDAGAIADLAGYLPDRLELLHATDQAALFRVRRPK